MIKKILLIAIAVIVIVVIGLTVLVKVYITPESVKAFIIPEAEKALNRKVQLGEVDISLFKGIQVRDFAIKESDGTTDFISGRDFVFKYRFLPLLSRRVIIEELRLDTPRISIVRDSKGTFNFDDIGQKREEPREDMRKDTESRGLPISLLVDNIVVKDASFSLRDHTKELPDTKGSIDIEMGIKSVSESEIASQGNISLRLDEIVLKDRPDRALTDISAGLSYAISVATESKDIRIEKADLTVQEIPVSFSGTLINLSTSPEIDLAVRLAEAKTSDIERMIALFIDTKGLNLSGSLSSDMKVTGQPKQPDTLKVLADISMNTIGATYNTIPLSVDGSIQADVTTQKAHIRKADLTLQDIPVSVTGTVTHLNTSPALDISLSLPDVKTASLEKALSSLSGIQDLNLSGGLSADLQVTGMPKKIETLQANGDITLNDLGALYGDINTRLNGTLKFRGQSVDIRTTVQSGKNSAEISGSVKNYFKKPDININLYSSRLSLDELIPTGKSEGKTPAAQDTPPSKKGPEEPEPLDLDLSARGEIRIDSALYRNMDMSDFYASYLLKDNRFEIKKLNAVAGKGRLDLNSLIDFSKPGYAYSLTFSLDSLHAEEVVNAFVPKAKDTVFGILSLDLALNGNGTLPGNMRKNLAGNGKFTIQNGKITNSRLPEQLALFLGIEELKTIHIREADGTVKIRDGSARLKSLFSSDDITMDPSGTIGLDEILDLAFDLKLSPKLTGKATMNSNIAQYIQDEKGWGSIPLKVSGTFSEPSYTVDVVKAGKRVIKKEADKVIDTLFDEKDEKKQKEMAPVKDLLKGILK
jgi:AsmA protein